eukprot:scaffold17784_cov22-Tisochrysis_lutea.AAC.1
MPVPCETTTALQSSSLGQRVNTRPRICSKSDDEYNIEIIQSKASSVQSIKSDVPEINPDRCFNSLGKFFQRLLGPQHSVHQIGGMQAICSEERGP